MYRFYVLFWLLVNSGIFINACCREVGEPELSHEHFTSAIKIEPTVAQVWWFCFCCCCCCCYCCCHSCGRERQPQTKTRQDQTNASCSKLIMLLRGKKNRVDLSLYHNSLFNQSDSGLFLWFLKYHPHLFHSTRTIPIHSIPSHPSFLPRLIFHFFLQCYPNPSYSFDYELSSFK